MIIIDAFFVNRYLNISATTVDLKLKLCA